MTIAREAWKTIKVLIKYDNTVIGMHLAPQYISSTYNTKTISNVMLFHMLNIALFYQILNLASTSYVKIRHMLYLVKFWHILMSYNKFEHLIKF